MSTIYVVLTSDTDDNTEIEKLFNTEESAIEYVKELTPSINGRVWVEIHKVEGDETTEVAEVKSRRTAR